MGKGYVIFLAIFAATGSFLFGYDSGVMSNVIASENFLEYFDTDPDSDIIGALNSTFSGGAAIGALIAGELSDILGRKYTIQIGATIATVGAVLQFAAVKIVMLLVGRIISGFAIGVLSMVIPVYQTECSHPKSRGLIVGIAQQMIGAGWIISTWTGFGSGYAHGQFQWRFPLSVQALPSIILMFGMFIFPESPRHLIKQGQYDTGKAVLRKLHYDGTNDDWIEQEYTEIKDSYCAESELTVNPWRAMFVIPQWRRRLLIATGMHAFGQSTGINAIGYYQTIMYRDLGLTGHMIPLMACFYNLVGPSTCLFFILFLVDKVGRRKPLLWGTVAITIVLAGEALFQGINPDNENKAESAMGILCIWLVTGFFSLSYGPVCWTYISEILPMQIRGTGVAFATGIGHWGMNVLWSQTTPKGLNKIKWGWYLVFVAVNVFITFPCIYFFFPETKGVPLEEMDIVFGGTPDLSQWTNVQALAEKKQAVEHVDDLEKGSQVKESPVRESYEASTQA